MKQVDQDLNFFQKNSGTIKCNILSDNMIFCINKATDFTVSVNISGILVVA